jgi:hypothetical protein
LRFDGFFGEESYLSSEFGVQNLKLITPNYLVVCRLVLQLSTIIYKVGIKTRVRSVETKSPPMTAMASEA